MVACSCGADRDSVGVRGFANGCGGSESDDERWEESILS